MKVLIVGNRQHQLIVNLINAMKKDNITYDILSQDSNEIEAVDYNTFESILNLKLPKWIIKNRYLRGVFKQIAFRNKVRSLNDYDFIHIHYIEDIILRDLDYFLRNIKGKIIVSIWGSDFLRADNQKRERIKKLLLASHKVTIANSFVRNEILKFYGQQFDEKIEVLRFFVKPLDNLINCSTVPILKSNIVSFDPNKIVVTVGYNASTQQQHLDIIESIFQDKKLLAYKDKLAFVVPLTYPSNTEYVSLIKEKVSKSQYSFDLITDFLNNEDLINLRKRSDIFIQLQVTDMMSASMLEHLYADNIVITGSWLPYAEFKEWGLIYEEIDAVGELGTKLAAVIVDREKNKLKVTSNSKIIREKFERDSIVKQWLGLYK